MKRRILKSGEITYESWLEYIVVKPKNMIFENYMFPNEKIKERFISSIHSHTEETLHKVLSNFLEFTGTLGLDNNNVLFLASLKDNNEEQYNELLNKSFYYRKVNEILINGGNVEIYSNLQWVIELLPDYPRDSLNVLSAFLKVHFFNLPDGRIHGLLDAMSIIRARYFDKEVDKSILYSLSPSEFEHVVETLYNKMGYETKMTKSSHDGARDIVAIKIQEGRKEHLEISCKRKKHTVTALEYREVIAAVADSKATKGVVITTSDFSKEAYKYAHKNPQLELINQKSLQKLLNEFLGANWSLNLENYIQDSQKRHKKANRI